MAQINFMYPYSNQYCVRIHGKDLNQCAYGLRGALDPKLRGVEHTTTNIGDNEAELLRGGWRGETEDK